jgi:hypothetical protein
VKPFTVLYQETHWHYCPTLGHRDIVECASGPNCSLRFKVACPTCVMKLCTGRANQRAQQHWYRAQA